MRSKVEEMYYSGVGMLTVSLLFAVLFGLLWWHFLFEAYGKKYGEEAAVDLAYKIFLVPDHQRDNTIFAKCGIKYKVNDGDN